MDHSTNCGRVKDLMQKNNNEDYDDDTTFIL
jgi:hypothetical protein